jgi:metal-responsive CopG/Arc/MetJ family transcriptional regulator
MPDEMIRTHIVMPKDLVDEVDRRVGPRQRSAFVVEAVEEKLRQVRRLEIARKAAGSLAEVEIPGWETTASTVAWVRRLRAADARRLEGGQRRA